MAISKACWGIDVGQCALKAIKLRHSGGGVEAVSFDVIEHAKILSQPDADEQQLIRNALDKFLSRNDVKNDLVVVGVPGQASFSRFIKLPPVELRKVPEIVQYEARQQIPFNLNDVIWDYQTMTMPTGGTAEIEVGIFAMKRDIVQDYVNDFTQVKVVPDIVQMAPVALYNYLQYDRSESSGATLLVDVGAENTSLVIADGYRVWIRNFPLGGNNFTQALVKAFKLTFSKAENLKRHAAESKYAKEVFQAMRPVFSDLQTEIQRSIGFYTSLHRESRIERLLAMGSTFRLPGLQKYLSQNLGVEVTKVDHFSSLGGDQVTGAPVFKENVLSFGVAYGLALQGLGLGAIATSLLPPEILKEKELKRKRPFVVAAAAAVVVGFALLGIGANQSLKATGRPADAPLDIGDPDRPVKNVLKAVESFVSENQKSVTAVAANKMALKEKQKELDQYTQLEKYRDLWYTILTDVWTLTTSGPQQEAYRQWDPRKPHTDWENLEIVEITDLWSEFTNAEPASDEIGRTPGSTIGGGSKTPIMIVNIRGTAPMKRGQTPALIVEERLINKLLQTRAIYDELVSKLKTGGLGAELIDKLKTGVVDAELAGKLQSLGISPKLIERLKSRARGGYIQGIKMEEVGIYRGHQDYPYEKEKPVEGAEGAQPGEMRRTTSSGTGKEEDQVQPKRPWRGDDVSFLVRFFINLDDPSKAVEYTYANLAKRDGPSYQ